MRILWDCRSINPHMGGIGHANVGWLREFLRKRPVSWAVQLMFSTINSDKNAYFDEFLSSQNASIITVDAALIDSRFEQFSLPILLERQRIECYVNPCFTIPAIKTTRLQIAVIHDIVFYDHPEWVDVELCKYLRHGTDLAMRKADAVFTVSNYSRQRINAFGKLRGWNTIPKINVVYPKIADNLIAIAKSGKLPLKPVLQDDPNGFILYLGSIEEKKGINNLLDGYKILQEKMLSSCPQLVFAGGIGGQRYNLNAGISGRNLHNVKCLGRVSDEEKLQLYNAANLFVFPSHYEGFGIPPLEAMACGVPVVAARSTSLPEVCGDGALFYDVNDCNALADVFARILNEKSLREQMIVKGRDNVLKNIQQAGVVNLIDQLKALTK